MYKINEYFYSLQGEGARAGSANIFIRLSNCNLSCSYCDTEFDSGIFNTTDQVLENIKKFPCKDIIFTGGEPLLQLNDNPEILRVLKENGYKLILETNGSLKPSIRDLKFDWITVSPKVSEHVIKRNFSDLEVNELRYVRAIGQSLPVPSISAENYFLSPQNNGDKINPGNVDYCIELILRNDSSIPWKLSVQQHKLWKVR